MEELRLELYRLRRSMLDCMWKSNPEVVKVIISPKFYQQLCDQRHALQSLRLNIPAKTIFDAGFTVDTLQTENFIVSADL